MHYYMVRLQIKRADWILFVQNVDEFNIFWGALINVHNSTLHKRYRILRWKSSTINVSQWDKHKAKITDVIYNYHSLNVIIFEAYKNMQNYYM